MLTRLVRDTLVISHAAPLPCARSCQIGLVPGSASCSDCSPKEVLTVLTLLRHSFPSFR